MPVFQTQKQQMPRQDHTAQSRNRTGSTPRSTEAGQPRSDCSNGGSCPSMQKARPSPCPRRDFLSLRSQGPPFCYFPFPPGSCRVFSYSRFCVWEIPSPYPPCSRLLPGIWVRRHWVASLSRYFLDLQGTAQSQLSGADPKEFLLFSRFGSVVPCPDLSARRPVPAGSFWKAATGNQSDQTWEGSGLVTVKRVSGIYGLRGLSSPPGAHRAGPLLMQKPTPQLGESL